MLVRIRRKEVHLHKVVEMKTTMKMNSGIRDPKEEQAKEKITVIISIIEM
jgi:hypothetical protein